ncbi:MAG: 1,3-propanediol dehydrogenase [Clostridia bacterium]|nr:1,3-propanediol dehydrogenase [Clostridia bacterium]
MQPYEFQTTTRIVFGPGLALKAGEEVVKLGGTKALIVTDPGVEKAGLLNGLIEGLTAARIPYSVFNKVEPNPYVEIFDEGAGFLKKHQCNVVIGIGGGSSMDVAKGIGILATNGGSIKDYAQGLSVKNPPIPVLAVPTTAGTGSEVSWHISVKDKASNFKMSVRSPYAMPRVAILDPTLLATLPASVIAATGMDAFTHALECYISPLASELTDAIAERSLKLIANNLRPFFANPKNIEAAGNMLQGAMMAGMLISHARTGAVHAMSRPLGGFFNLSHGLANAILLPYVMRFNWVAQVDKFANLAQIMGEPVDRLSKREAALKAIEAVENLCKDLDIPLRLRDVGVTPDKIPLMAQDAMEIGTMRLNPRIASLEQVISIYQMAF